jgi:hypothetical protein
MTPKTMAEKILELHKAATPGPWYAYGKGSGRVEISPKILTYTKYEPLISYYDPQPQPYTDRKNSAEFAAQSRMIAPELARHYLKAVDLLHAVIGNGNYETLGDLNDAIHNFLLEHEKDEA